MLRPKLPAGGKGKLAAAAALFLWTLVAVSFYLFSIKEGLLWPIHVYMGIALPTLAAAVVVNGYYNAKFAKSGETPPEALVRRVKTAVKTLIIIGLPPFFCVLFEYVAGWLSDKF